MMTRICRRALAATLLLGPVLCAGLDARLPDLPDEVTVELERLRERIPEEDRFEAEGLIADRRTREVVLFALATGLGPEEPVEFILIGPDSAHAYEALAVSLALPSDIARAIEFIDVPRGQTAFSAPMTFWPRGERVLGWFRPAADEAADAKPLELLVFDRQRDAPLPDRGLVYCGSHGLNGDFAADGASPGAVISTYNEPTTVFDLPHMASQSEVYERFTPNPEWLMAPETLLRIRLQPEPRPEGRPRVERYRMRIAPATDAPAEATGLAAIAVTLERTDNRNAKPETRSPAAAFARLRDRVTAGFDPFVTPVFEDSLTLEAAQAFAAALERFEGPNGLRVEAPPDGQLYYRAFLPHAVWRIRDQRAAQPLELHVTPEDDTATAKLTPVEIRQHWREDHYRPELEPVEHPSVSPAALPAALADIGPGLGVILVFAPPETALGAFMTALRDVQQQYPKIHLFSGLPLDTAPEPAPEFPGPDAAAPAGEPAAEPAD